MATLIKNAIIIDGTGAKPRKGHSILIKEDRITRIVPDKFFPPEKEEKFEVINASGKYVIPGIIDLHQHFLYKRTYGNLWGQFKLPIPILTTRAIKNGLAELREGITTVREVGSVHGISTSMKYMIQHGFIPGPRIFTAGQPLAMTGAHSKKLCQTADGVDEIRKRVREWVETVDWIKTFASSGFGDPEYTREELRVMAEETHRAGKKIAAHAMGFQAIQNSVEAGIDTIEHGIYLNKTLARIMRERGIALIPTLSAYIQNLNPRFGRDSQAIKGCANLIKPHKKSFLAALEEDVKLGLGLDSLGDLREELSLWRSTGGMDPLEIIKICTFNGAEILGVEDTLGSVEEGKVADLVILNADPLTNIGDIDKVHMVIKEGKALQPEEIILPVEYESPEYNSLVPEYMK